MDPGVAEASVLSGAEGAGGTPGGNGRGGRPGLLPEGEDRREIARQGAAVVSGRTHMMLASEDVPPTEESPAVDVAEAQGTLTNTMGQVLYPDWKGSRPQESPQAAGMESPGVAAPVTDPQSPGGSMAAVGVREVQPGFRYSAWGRRDPFRPLVREGEDTASRTGKLNLDEAQLVGILWGGRMEIALLEDFEGISYCLKVGDRVRDGRLAAIRSDSVVFTRTRYGRGETVVLELKEKKAGGS